MKLISLFLVLCLCGFLEAAKPNVVWICVEDASPHIGCYGEKAIQTPNIDHLANQGTLFEKAFVTAPVCSTSRSAMVTGMYQTTSGLLHHRSQSNVGKASGNEDYYESYKLPSEILTVAEIFKQHGYYVSNKTKTDYNFIRDGIYDSKKDWKGRQPGQPFFAQFQLIGGKSRKSKEGVDQTKMKLPPYYPDTEIMRADWANYLGSWVKVDRDVKEIVNELKKEDLLENTIIFFWTDHGLSHIRGKQFLYDEGIQVPLIIKPVGSQAKGLRRSDMVSHLDIPVTSLALAGIKVPEYMDGKVILGGLTQEQKYIYTARDRCDETVDILRSVRTQKYKYIRNFLPHCSHMQRSQYKEGKKIVQHAKLLFSENKLNELQSKPFKSDRPIEELYDLENDPYETVNLAYDLSYARIKSNLKSELYAWMIETKDMGLIPEPILEDLGKQYKNKYYILQADENEGLVSELIDLVEAAEKADIQKIKSGLNSSSPSKRYWAVKSIGNRGLQNLKQEVYQRLKDDNACVRISAAESIAQLGDLTASLKVLKEELKNKNVLTGLYAIRSIEALGVKAKNFAAKEVKECKNSSYEFTRRVAKRLIKEWEL